MFPIRLVKPAAFLVGFAIAFFITTSSQGSENMQWSGFDLSQEMHHETAALPSHDLPQHETHRAPGFLPEAEHPRRFHELQDHWVFRPIIHETQSPGVARDVELPMQWKEDRDYRAAWFLQNLNLTPQPGSRIIMAFEQVPNICVLFVNGREAGRHRGSFTPFEFDITDLVTAGPNAIAIYVHDEWAAVGQKEAWSMLGLSRFPTPGEDHPWKFPARGGISAPVTLEIRPEAYLNDVFITTSVRKKEMKVKYEVNNASQRVLRGRVQFQVREWPTGETVALPIPPQDVELPAGQISTFTVTVPWADAHLWSPEHPNLYVLESTLTCGEQTETIQSRFGFREFWIDGRRFILNGFPVRLRGESTFRGTFDRDFNREVMLDYKDVLGVNACRLSASITPRVVPQAADEAGLLLDCQSSVWSAMGRAYHAGGETFLDNARKEFAEWIRRDRNCPSIVIWDVENEMLRDDLNRIHRPWVMRLEDFVLEHDDTRPLNHAGAGWYDPKQQMAHLHMQEHYSKIMAMWNDKGTVPLVMGEFWVGGRGEERLPSAKEFSGESEFFEEEARMYEQAMLEMRRAGVWGIMPLTLRVTAFSDTVISPFFWQDRSKPMPPRGRRSPLVTSQLRHALQDMTIFFWNRSEAAVAGEEVLRELVICNDSESTKTLRAEWGLEGARLESLEVQLPAAGMHVTNVSVIAPKAGGKLVARLYVNGLLVSSDELTIRAIPASRLQPPSVRRAIHVYEGQTTGTVQALESLGIHAARTDGLPAGDPSQSVLIIAPNATDPQLNRMADEIRSWLERGGRILCLTQEKWPRWSPLRFGFWPAVRAMLPDYKDFGWPEGNKDLYFSTHAPIYAPSHPVFEDMPFEDLRWWDAFDGRVSDDALVRPAAVGDRAQGAWRVLAGATRYENVSLAEARMGEGLLVFSQAQVLKQSHHPEARALLNNLLRYLDGEAWKASSGAIALAGLDREKIAAQTGIQPSAFSDKAKVLFAGDDADPESVLDVARNGGTAFVLSASLAKRLPGYEVTREEDVVYAGSREQDHPLLWGVASTSFSDVKNSCVEGELSAFPSDARVLLNGLKGPSGKMWLNGILVDAFMKNPFAPQEAAPVAVAQQLGKGELIVTTLAPWRNASPHNDELMSVLLANAGAAIEPVERRSHRARVYKTVPLILDGQLDDWTSDMDDKNVSPWCHADPIVLSSEETAAGSVSGDAEFSGIVYLLWNEENLYVGGVALGRKTADRVVVQIGDHSVNIETPGPQARASIAHAPQAAVECAGAMLNKAEEMTDTRALSFSIIDPRIGKLRTETNISGATFEARIAWTQLGFDGPPSAMKALVRMERKDGVSLQVPLVPEPSLQSQSDSQDRRGWLELEFTKQY